MWKKCQEQSAWIHSELASKAFALKGFFTYIFRCITSEWRGNNPAKFLLNG